MEQDINEQTINYSDDSNQPSFSQKAKPVLTDIRLALMKIWPTVYRMINTAFYFILNILKSIVSLAIQQIKQH